VKFQKRIERYLQKADTVKGNSTNNDSTNNDNNVNTSNDEYKRCSRFTSDLDLHAN